MSLGASCTVIATVYGDRYCFLYLKRASEGRQCREQRPIPSAEPTRYGHSGPNLVPLVRLRYRFQSKALHQDGFHKAALPYLGGLFRCGCAAASTRPSSSPQPLRRAGEEHDAGQRMTNSLDLSYSLHTSGPNFGVTEFTGVRLARLVCTLHYWMI